MSTWKFTYINQLQFVINDIKRAKMSKRLSSKI